MKDVFLWKIMLRELLIFALVMPGLVIGNAMKAQAAVPDDQAIKTKFYSFKFEVPEPSMVIIYLVRNITNADVEVIYDLTSDVSIGGIEAVIDVDGPFGPKEPEPYHWKKVPLTGGGDQYLIVTFPLPDGYEPGMKITPSVRLVPEPRG